MEKNILISIINQFLSGDSLAAIYGLMTDGTVQRINFQQDTQKFVKNLFLQNLKDYANDDIIEIKGLSVADENENAIYKFDYEELPEGLSCFNDVFSAEQMQQFTQFIYSKENVKQIKAIITYIPDDNLEHYFIFYKTISGFDFYEHEKHPMFFNDDNQIKRVNNDFIQIYPHAEMFYYDSDLYIRNLKPIETKFKFHEVIVHHAKSQVNVLSELNLLEDITILNNAVDDVAVARSLNRVMKQSDVLNKHVPNSDIVNFARQHPMYRVLADEGSQYLRITSNNQVLLFFKLLNQDILKGDLTNDYYDIKKKKRF